MKFGYQTASAERPLARVDGHWVPPSHEAARQGRELKNNRRNLNCNYLASVQTLSPLSSSQSLRRAPKRLAGIRTVPHDAAIARDHMSRLM